MLTWKTIPLGHTLAGIVVSLGLFMNFEAITARYANVRLERKKDALDAYHDAAGKQNHPKQRKPNRKSNMQSKEKKQRFRALADISFYRFL